MIVLEGVMTVQVADGQYEERSHTFKIKDQPNEVTLREYCDFVEKVRSFPDWFLELVEAESLEKRSDIVANWLPRQWKDYYVFVLEILDSFSPNKESLADLIPANEMTVPQIIALYVRVTENILGYKPKRIKSFEYKGDTYLLPKTSIGPGGETVVGSRVRVIEAVEAMQVEQVFSSVDEEGNLIFDDSKYRIDIAVAAIFSRKVIGTQKAKVKRAWYDPRPRFIREPKAEEIPYETHEWDDFIAKRIAHFEGLPLDIAQDIYFFLRNLSRNSKLMGSFGRLLSLLKQGRS